MESGSCKLLITQGTDIEVDRVVSPAQAKGELAELQQDLPRYEQDAKKKVENAPEREIMSKQWALDYTQSVVNYYSSYIVILQACVGGKSITPEQVDRQLTKVTLSTADGKLSDAGIAVVVSVTLLVALGGLVAALPALKPMLPAEIANLLP